MYALNAQPAAPERVTCRVCGMTDPPSAMTCDGGRDHYVGPASGCRYCGRLKESCAARRCQAMRAAPAWRACVAALALIRAAFRQVGPGRN
jgi:hypothetical protein